MTDPLDLRSLLLSPTLLASLALVAVLFQALRLWGRLPFAPARTSGRAGDRRLTTFALLAALVLPFAGFLVTVPDGGPAAAAPPAGPTVSLSKGQQSQFQAAGYASSNVSLTITSAVVAGPGVQTVTTNNTTNVRVGKQLLVDTGTGMEAVIVTAVPNATSFSAVFAKTHAANVPARQTDGTVAFNATSVSLGVTTTPAAGLPAAVFNSGSAPAIGRGGHAIQGQNGRYLIVHGGCTATWSVYDAIANTLSAGSPNFGANICTGAFSVKVGADRFLLVAGGRGEAGSNPLATIVIDATATGFTVPAASVTAPVLTGTTGAGAGAHAIKRSDGNLVIIHGGGTTGSTYLTTSTLAASAGPAGLAAAVGAGALSIPRTADDKWFTLVGGALTNTFLYDQSTVPGTFTAGTATPNNYGPRAGAHAIQYTDASQTACSTAPYRCYRVVVANGTRTATYDPAGPATATLAVSSATFATTGDGSFSLRRGDGSFLMLRGGTTEIDVFSATANPAAFSQAPFTAPGTTGAGAFALQKPDGMYLAFMGGGTAAVGLYDAGIQGRGTYTTEPIDPGNVNQWMTLAWTKTADLGLTLRVRTASSSAGLSAATYTDTAATSATSGSAPITAPVADKWIQAEIVPQRPIPSSGDAQAEVWSAGGIAYDRSTTADPRLTQLRLDYTTGLFVVTAASPQKVGLPFAVAATLRDTLDSPIAGFGGTRVLIYSGANSAPDGTSPTTKNMANADIPFGSGVTVEFTSGSGSASVTLYKAETANLAVSHITGTGTTATYTLTSVTITTASPASVLVEVATSDVTDADNSSVSVSPSSVPADGVQLATVTITLRDALGNPAPGRTPGLASSRGGLDVIVQPGATNTAGQATATVRSLRAGVSSLTASEGGVTITQQATVDFRPSRYTVTTQGSGTQTAGTAFSITLVASGADGVAAANYAGSHAVAFSSTATQRVSPVAGVAPTIPSSLTLTFDPAGAAVTTVSFILTNSAETPTITAAEAGGPAGTSAAITVLAGALSATQSTVSANPATGVPNDNVTTSTLSARTLDASRNPLPGHTVAFATDRTASDTIAQPSGPTDANGLASGTIRSSLEGISTISATATKDSVTTALAQTASVTFTATFFEVTLRNDRISFALSAAVTTTGAPTTVAVTNTTNLVAGMVVAVDTGPSAEVVTVSAVPSPTSITATFARTHLAGTTVRGSLGKVTAGIPFTVHVRAVDGTGATVTNYNGFKTITFTSTATARVLPKAGFAPTIPSPQGFIFNQGEADAPTQFVFTNSGESPTISARDVVSPSGTSPATTVEVHVVSASSSEVSVAPQPAGCTSDACVPADGATNATVTVRVYDSQNNPLGGRTVNVFSSRGVADTIQQAGVPTDANGMVQALIRSTGPGIATISASVNPKNAAGLLLAYDGSTVTITQTRTIRFAGLAFEVSLNPGGTTSVPAGLAFTVHLRLRDELNNTVTTYNGTHTISFTTTATARVSPAAGPAPVVSAAQDISFVNGEANSLSSSQFVLYNTSQTPVIRASESGQYLGGTAALTITPLEASLSASLFTTDPSVAPGDGVHPATATVTVTDVYHNPKEGFTVTITTDGVLDPASEQITQPASVTGANGVATATVNSKVVRTATYTATISGPGGVNGVLVPTAQVVWTQPTSTGSFTVAVSVASPTAGVGFQITITAVKASGGTDTGYCTSGCALIISHTATAAPDGTAAVPVSGGTHAMTFVNGVFTSTTADGFVRFYRAAESPTITVRDANDASATGTSAAIPVVAGPPDPAVSRIIATPRTTATNATTTSGDPIRLWGRALDRYRNPNAGETVTLACVPACPATASLQDPTSQVDSTGTSATSASLRSTVTGPITLSATLSPSGVTITGTTVYFTSDGFGVMVGTYYGNTAQPKFPLEIVAECRGGCLAPYIPGAPLPESTIVYWDYTSANGGTGDFDNPSGVPFGATMNTTGAYGTPEHRTSFKVTRAGSFCIRAHWQNPDASVTTVNVACGTNGVTGISIFDVTSTTAQGAVATARAIWNGTDLRVIGWITDR